MERTRVAALAALFVVLSVGSVAFASGTGAGPEPLGAVAWPPSTLLVSEVQTGGASASDEFAEITNVGASAVDLAGLELVYATSSGSTVTRKASWSTSLLLDPGRHLFVANTSGIYAGLADATYSGGFAATGGAIVLRAIGGTPVDAIGWGDATNAFVEGSPMTAPSAGSSIERKPGGIDGNTIDSNANSVDWFTQPSPNPQSLAAPPVPAPSASPTPVATAVPTAGPTIAATPMPTGTPVPTSNPTPIPTATVAPTPTPEPTPIATPGPTGTTEPMPTATPTATAEPTPQPTGTATVEPTVAPTPTASVGPTLAPTPTPSPVITSIADARALADGTSATVIGVLTTQLGALESGRKAFIQDATGGIAIYLDIAVEGALPAGTQVMATGTLDDRFAERTLRVALADLVALGDQARPDPVLRATGTIGEGDEGARVVVEGITIGSPTSLADGLGLMVDDGTGEIRVIVGPAAFGLVSVPSGTTVVAMGPVGQRDSTGTGLSGYRIHATETGDFSIILSSTPTPTVAPTDAPTPSPTPVPTPASTPAPTATSAPTSTPMPPPSPTAAPTPFPTQLPTPTPVASGSPSATPSPTANPGSTPPPVIDIVEARAAAVGSVVTVEGVVTAESGRLGLPPVFAIADGTGGIAIRLPDGVPAAARGTQVRVRGPLADPYGQLELRPGSGGIATIGHGSLPAPVQLAAAQLGEATEGRLADLTGTVTAPPRKSTSGDLAIDLVDAAGTAFRVIADGSSGIAVADLGKDRTYRLTGIVGQRASRKGALDGYRLYLRDRADITSVAAPGGPGASPAGAGGVKVVPVTTALAMPDGAVVTIEATVTAGASLLDASGRRIVVQDRSGAIEVLLPSGSTAPASGGRIRVTGAAGRAWGAPRIAATQVTSLDRGAAPQTRTLHRAPAERDEWQLVRISGTVAKVNRIGERWRAEVTLADGTDVLVQGQPGAGIPSTAVVVGRRITVTGIVRRPYPTASDRRFAILPRDRGDLSLGSGGEGLGSGTEGSKGAAATDSAGTATGADAVTPDTDLATLGEAVGKQVKVGGLIVRIAHDGFDLDDGTALARVELRGTIAALLSHLREHEAIAAMGVVALVDGAPIVIVDDAGGLVRVGALGEALPIGGANPSPTTGAGQALTAGTAGIGNASVPEGVLALATIVALSVLATVARRRLVRDRLRLAVVARLGALHGGERSPANAVATTAEHESA